MIQELTSGRAAESMCEVARRIKNDVEGKVRKVKSYSPPSGVAAQSGMSTGVAQTYPRRSTWARDACAIFYATCKEGCQAGCIKTDYIQLSG